MAEALIVSGGGRYSDEWHPFEETSAAIATVLEELGMPSTVVDDPDRALSSLPVLRPPLVVLNIGDAPSPSPSGNARAGLLSHLSAGRPMLAIHSTATAFGDWTTWQSVLGGRWVRGVGYHPPRDWGTVLVPSDRHPITDGLRDFDIDDELYAALTVDEDSVVIAEHELEGVRHALAWAHEFRGARVVYDALGHDAVAHRNPARRELLLRELSWLTGP